MLNIFKKKKKITPKEVLINEKKFLRELIDNLKTKRDFEYKNEQKEK